MNRSFWSGFWRLARPYWVSEDRWAAWTLFAVLVSLSLAIVWVNVELNTWQGAFYNSLQDKRFDEFRRLLLVFAGWAFLYIVFAVYQLYLTQMLTIRWRRWLTDVWLRQWMADAAHYRVSLADFGSDNPDQRIAEDLRDFVDRTLSLFFGLLSSVVTFVSFVGILWALSGAIEVAGITIPGYMVWIAIVYALIGSVLAHRVGKPLIGLSFEQQRYEADFRFALVRARENAEGIALYRGEEDELKGFRQRFTAVVDNWWRIMRRQKLFTWYASFYGQLAIIFPFVVGAPRYFSGAIELGGLMQISNAFGKVQSALSWLVDSYTTVATWRASIERLNGFARALEQARALGADLRSREGGSVDLQQVMVGVPLRDRSVASPGNSVPLIQADGETIEPGRHTLIVGPSGSGKSTLFRLLAGIWPFGQGQFERTASDDSLFLPQKPYLPLGTLRAVVTYPRQQLMNDDARIREALQAVGLASFEHRLDENAHWSQILSGGEQQRLAAARALLIAPRWLYLDEATSALDEDAEQSIYRLLRERLPQTTIVSIAHRPAVAPFHSQRLRVVPQQTGPARLALEPLVSGKAS